MRVLFFYLILVQLGFGCPSLEVRAYLAPSAGFFDPMADERGWVVEPEKVDFSKLEVVKKPPFQSRFFSEGDELRDLTPWAVAMYLAREESEEVIWNETTGRMVVRADEWGHREMVEHFKGFLEVKPRIGIEVLELKGVKIEGRGLVSSKIPDDADRIGRVTRVRDDWEWKEVDSDEGKVSLEIGDFGHDLEIWELGVGLRSEIPGSKFEVSGTFMGIIGKPMVVEIGSSGGRNTIAAVINVEGVLGDGVILRDWVLDEDGGRKWWKEAVADSVGPWRDPALDGDRKVRRRFSVPPTFRTFISGVDEDSEELGPMELLMRNGVGFEEGDRVLFYEESLILEVISNRMTMELVEGIISAGQSQSMRMIRGSYVLVESKVKLTEAMILNGELRIREKVNCFGLPGQMSKVALGKKRSVLEMEAQIDSEDSVVEVRYELKSKIGGDVKSGGVFQVDRPVIVQQAKVGKKWRAWVLTASILRVEDYLEEE